MYELRKSSSLFQLDFYLVFQFEFWNNCLVPLVLSKEEIEKTTDSCTQIDSSGIIRKANCSSLAAWVCKRSEGKGSVIRTSN